MKGQRTSPIVGGKCCVKFSQLEYYMGWLLFINIIFKTKKGHSFLGIYKGLITKLITNSNKLFILSTL